MFLRTLIFAFLAVGALAVKLELSDAFKESFKSTLTTICNKTSGDAEANAEQIVNSVQPFFDCLYTIVDTDTLYPEIRKAQADGVLPQVFKKYCDQVPKLKTCLHTLIDAASPCTGESAKDQLTLAKNASDRFFDYACYNDGSRMFEFQAENGPECVRKHSKELESCVDNFKTQAVSIQNFVSFTLAEKCLKFDEVTTCLFKTLQTCTPPTPGNLLESLVKYAREGACKDALPLPPAPQ